MAKFRLGDAGLGNRGSPRVVNCPLGCGGENSESHLVFRCSGGQELREMMDQSVRFKDFVRKTALCRDDIERLQLFLGGDRAEEEELVCRSTFLSILKDKNKESMDELYKGGH